MVIFSFHKVSTLVGKRDASMNLRVPEKLMAQSVTGPSIVQQLVKSSYVPIMLRKV